ncbi:MAG: UDP-N-acetylmuramate dehydrogenase [Bdellovibrio sp.]
MRIQTQYDLSSLNTLQLRSQADHLVELRTPQDLEEVLSDSSLKKMPWHILGGGSNVVLPSFIQGLVLKTAAEGFSLNEEDSQAWFVEAEAGVNWHQFVQWTLQQGYAGLENLSLIPGTVGAAPIQNIGAYGVEIKDLLWQVHAYDLRSGEKRIFSNKECQFSYRDSFFKNEGAGHYLVWKVVFRLPKKNILHLEYGDIRKELDRMQVPASAQNISDAVIHIRQSKLPDPRVIGNAGSFFKNPIVPAAQRDALLQKHPDLVSYPYREGFYKLAAGWLIDKAGWKGQRQGPVGMYEKQALVLVNHGGATATDVWSLAHTVAQDVHTLFSVTLAPEPIRW